MQLEWLVYFSEVVKAGTISAAAEALHISQPALSKTIKNLENELGQLLLKRTNHGVFPTALGEKVYADFIDMQSTMQKWYSQKNMFVPEGQIHVCSIACASNYILNNVIAPFRQKYPKVDIVLHDLRVQTVIQTLKNTSSNIAITSLPLPPNNKIITQAESLNWPVYHLFTGERQLLIGASHPMAKQDVLSVDDLKQLSLAYYSTEQDIISTIYEPYFASSYKLATREHIMELVINNVATFIPIYNLMQNDFYITKQLVKAFPLPVDEIDSHVPVVVITTSKLSPCEILFRDSLLQHFSDFQFTI